MPLAIVAASIAATAWAATWAYGEGTDDPDVEPGGRFAGVDARTWALAALLLLAWAWWRR